MPSNKHLVSPSLFARPDASGKHLVFADHHVRALMAGRLSQIRIPVGSQPPGLLTGYVSLAWLAANSPVGLPGQIIPVLESWRTYRSLDDTAPNAILSGAGIEYQSGGTSLPGVSQLEGMGCWRSAASMPTWASRFEVIVTGLGICYLFEMSTADCINEGFMGGHACIPGSRHLVSPIEHFVWSWDQLHPELPWALNPWVWRIQIRRNGGAD